MVNIRHFAFLYEITCFSCCLSSDFPDQQKIFRKLMYNLSLLEIFSFFWLKKIHKTKPTKSDIISKFESPFKKLRFSEFKERFPRNKCSVYFSTPQRLCVTIPNSYIYIFFLIRQSLEIVFFLAFWIEKTFLYKKNSLSGSLNSNLNTGDTLVELDLSISKYRMVGTRSGGGMRGTRGLCLQMPRLLIREIDKWAGSCCIIQSPVRRQRRRL